MILGSVTDSLNLTLIFSDDLGFFQIIIEGFYGGDFSFYGFGLVLLVQMGDVVFNLLPLWGVGIGVCEILPKISFVGFEGVVVEFLAVFAEFQVWGEVGLYVHVF